MNFVVSLSQFLQDVKCCDKPPCVDELVELFVPKPWHNIWWISPYIAF